MNNDLNNRWAQVNEAIYTRARDIFPEFGFIPFAAGYKATTKIHVDGSEGKDVADVYLYANNPGYLKDYARGAVSIRNYISQRDGLEPGTATSKRLYELADMAGQWRDDTPPPDPYGQMWADVAEWCAELLLHKEDAEDVREYVRQRGYNVFDKNILGDLGFFPGKESIRKHLEGKGWPSGQVSSFVDASLTKGMGIGGHKLGIVLRDHRGQVRGMATRTIEKDYQGKYKYLYSKGIEKGNTVFGVTKSGIRASKGKIFLVEGILDGYAARMKGISNVGAIGGSSLGEGQIRAINDLDAKDIYLVMDADSAGVAGTDKAIQSLLKRDRYKIFVVAIPEGAKDLDELLRRAGGKELFLAAVDAAQEPSTWWAKQMEGWAMDQYTPSKSDSTMRADLAARVAEYVQHYPDSRQGEADRFIASSLRFLAPFHVTESDVKQYVANERRSANNARKQAICSDLKSDLDKINTSGSSPDEIISATWEKVSKAKGAMETGRMADWWRERYTKEQVLADLEAMGMGVRSGWNLNGKEIVIPQGVTFVAGPTGHGKTWFLLNLILSAARIAPDSTYHFFTYEMPRVEIAVRFMAALCGKNISHEGNEQALTRILKGDTAGMLPSDVETATLAADTFYRMLQSGRIVIHDQAPDVPALCDAIRGISKEEKVGMVAVDYMQLLPMPPGEKKNIRAEEIKSICLYLKDAANHSGVPLVVGSQFNRAVKTPNDLHYGNLSEGSDIEKIASMILAIWSGYQGPYQSDNLTVMAGEMYVTSLKVRSGKPLSGMLRFNGRAGIIETLPAEPKKANTTDNQTFE